MTRALYKRLVDEFLDKVSSGEIKVGERLPPEEDYAVQLGVSRSTLRLAFAKLEQSGIIKRRKRGGTEVISDSPQRRYDLVSSGVFDLLSLGRESEYLVDSVQNVSWDEVEDLADYHEISERWLAFSGTRFAAGQKMPFACSHVYVPERFGEIDINVGDYCKTIFRVIEETYGVSAQRVKQTISARACPEESAINLGLDTGEPVLAVDVDIEDTKGRLLVIGRSNFDPTRVNIQSDIRIGA